MTPRCRECNCCKATPYADEFTGEEYWAFECEINGKEIGTGADEDDALPKTCPRWCPRRAKNKKEDNHA